MKRNEGGRAVLETIGYPHQKTSSDYHASEELYEIARKNKVGSAYTKALHDAGELGGLEEQWENRRDFQQRVDQTLADVARDIPAEYEYALVKSRYDFWADSKDVDLILFNAGLSELKNDLMESGYEFCGDSPTSFDVLNPDTNVQLDIQSEFSLQRVVYFDAEGMRDGVQFRNVGDTRLPVVSQPDDLALIVIHSVTEQLFIFKEFYAAIHALESFSQRQFSQFLTVVDDNNIGAACRSFFTLIDEISREVFDRRPRFVPELLDRYPSRPAEREALRSNDFSTPHRYTRETAVRTILDKARNPGFLMSAVSQAPYLLRPSRLTHISGSILDRREREHYVHDTSDFEDGTEV